jgi:hypothetical protein
VRTFCNFLSSMHLIIHLETQNHLSSEIVVCCI